MMIWYIRLYCKMSVKNAWDSISGHPEDNKRNTDVSIIWKQPNRNMKPILKGLLCDTMIFGLMHVRLIKFA